MAEYRLDDLARVSGVSTRNIRAYRERGLLDAPRREGRSAYYDDYHVAQLRTITQLLRKGFSSTHIAEFLTGVREGTDLADVLGLRRAVLRPRRDHPGYAPSMASASTDRTGAAVASVDVDPGSDEARKLLDHGLAELVDGAVVLVDRKMGEIVARASDQLAYVRALLRILESTRQTTDELATEIVNALEECITSRFGPNHLSHPQEMSELSRIVQDYLDLANKAVADHLDEALQRQMVTAGSDYTAGTALGGQWKRNDS